MLYGELGQANGSGLYVSPCRPTPDPGPSPAPSPVTDAIPLFSGYIAPGSQFIGPLLSQLAASPLRSSLEGFLASLKSELAVETRGRNFGL